MILQNLRSKRNRSMKRIYSFDLVYAALIFEYLDPEVLLRNIRKSLLEKGILIVVLQMPDAGMPAVSKTFYKSLEKLTPVMNLQEPDRFKETAAENRFLLLSEQTLHLKSGKRFWTGEFSLIDHK